MTVEYVLFNSLSQKDDHTAGSVTNGITLSSALENYGPNFTLSLLQLDIGVKYHDKADEKLKEIEDNQTKSSEISKALTQIRNWKNQEGSSSLDNMRIDPNDSSSKLVKTVLSEHGVSISSKDNADDMISSLSAVQTDINNENNTLMVNLQDYTSKYSTSISAASTAATKGTDILASAAKRF